VGAAEGRSAGDAADSGTAFLSSWFRFETSSNQAHKLQLKAGKQESASKQAGLRYKSRRTKEILWLHNTSQQSVSS